MQCKKVNDQHPDSIPIKISFKKDFKCSKKLKITRKIIIQGKYYGALGIVIIFYQFFIISWFSIDLYFFHQIYQQQLSCLVI